MRNLLIASLGFLFSCLVWLSPAAAAEKPTVGVFYFPGWKDDALGGPAPKPWERLKNYPERKPLLGWYKEEDPKIMRQQVAWMNQYGIDLLIFDWYWSGEAPLVEHALQNYLAIDGKKPGFSIMWANHSAGPKSGAVFYSMVRYWIDNYFSQPSYLRIDGKPVVFIMLGDGLDEKAKAFGSSAENLLAKAQLMAKAAKLPGIYFVAGGGGEWIIKDAQGKAKGFSAYFAYNYHAGPGGAIGSERRMSRNYGELDKAYRRHWDWMMKFSNAPYILPVTAGWDKRPWGGSTDPLHDRSVSSIKEFKAQLLAAKELMRKNPDKTLNMTTICCWNEFGEGSYIEPTEGGQFDHLKAVLETFGP